MHEPTIIFLNGTSSAGKTSISRALQATLGAPFLAFSADLRKPMLPPYREGSDWDVNAVRDRLRHGYYACLAAFLATGNSVIADQAIERSEWLVLLSETLSETRTYLVGVRCPLAIVEERERERGDRALGLAREHFDAVHHLGIYDVEVDTSLLTPEAAAETIKSHVAAHPPQALRRILRQVVEAGGVLSRADSESLPENNQREP